MRRLVLVLALLAVLVAPGALASSSASKQTLARKLQKSLAVGGLSGSRTGALAADLHTGEILYAQNAGRPLAPASVEKLPVTYAALTALGPTFRFHTEVLGVGKRSGKVWRGDLVLRGYGDPTLTDRDLGSLASEVRSRGIRRVQGRILGDESFFDSRRTAPGWKSYYYMNECPPLSALVADRAVWEGRPTRWPAAAAAAGLKRALRRAGVRVHGRAVKAKRSSNGAGTVLASGQSGLLRKVLRFMAQESDNFTAEMVVKQLGALHGGGGTTAFGSGVVKELLTSEGIALGGVRIADGSGLSRYDRLTARTLVELLQAAWLSPSLHKPFLDALAVAGRSGTLSQRLTGRLTRGRVFAKTGTTLVSSSLAGFVKGRYAFAIINNGSPINSWAARVAQDRFVTVLARAA